MTKRILCLHGRGTSGQIFKSQTASFRYKLDPTSTTYTFDFLDAPHQCPPGPDIKLFYSPPYYTFYPFDPVSSHSSITDIRACHAWLDGIFSSREPYDGVMCFSQGCAVISSYLLYRNWERPGEQVPFKWAMFICGGCPLNVLDDLGIDVGKKAWEIDEATRLGLAEKVAALEASLETGEDRWATPASTTGSAKGVLEGLDPDAEVNPRDVCGLDTTKLGDMRITIPTVHVYGGRDPRWPASLQLAYLCDGGVRKVWNHGGGHDVPRGKEVSETLAGLVEWVVGMGEMV
ncbi:hypothetical protein BJ508DRAFT_414343 [Ascobolus immersus RN42]|uniref:Serine hydrolase domain-containing protein n=1 Tax=Ascobolus immersus RN42 TaxID=1160509 RepID=A0A3N4I7P5_ASCIM|nr:hypothetical protein BJ508DRAFT_414343 [Ascobolus immersus RN42]